MKSVLDVSSSRDLYSHTMVGWENKYREARSATTAEKETLIYNKNALTLGFKGLVEFREGNIRSLPVPDQSLDFAVSSMSLHHWSEPERALAEIHRVLTPGGQVLLFDMRRDSRLFFYMLLKFATTIVMPAAMRKLNEPMGSILASYTPMEVNELFAHTPFKTFIIKDGFAWMFVWGRKEPS